VETLESTEWGVDQRNSLMLGQVIAQTSHEIYPTIVDGQFNQSSEGHGNSALQAGTRVSHSSALGGRHVRGEQAQRYHEVRDRVHYICYKLEGTRDVYVRQYIGHPALVVL
jgi:hypothetical protein